MNLAHLRHPKLDSERNPALYQANLAAVERRWRTAAIVVLSFCAGGVVTCALIVRFFPAP